MEVLTWYLLYIYIWYTNIYDICVRIKSLSSVQVAWKSPFSWKVAPRWLATRLRLRFSFYLGPHHPITDRQMIQKRSFWRLTTSICWFGEMINWHVFIKLLCIHFGKESNRGNCNLFFLWSFQISGSLNLNCYEGLRKWWSLLIFISPKKKQRKWITWQIHKPRNGWWFTSAAWVTINLRLQLKIPGKQTGTCWGLLEGHNSRRKPTRLMIYMDVSENRGTPKWMVYGKPY